MGCVSSSPANAAANSRAPTSRAAGVYETKRPQLQHDSLSLAAAALAGVPPRTADDDSTSSSSGSISETGYSSEDDMASNSSLGTDQGILAGMAHSHGLEHAMVPPGSQHRPPMSSVKTTYKLRVGVLEGTTFLNQYIVVDTLGRGSFGKVKLCLHTGDDTLYAVKVVNTRALRAGAKSRLQSLTMLGQSRRGRNGGASAWDGAADAGAGAGTFGSGSQAGATPSSPTCNLRREVEVMRSLSHPNLVRLFEVIEDSQGGKVLMVMEYCEAGALVGPGALSPDRHLPEPMAQYYFRQMAAGLAYLHQNHVVHGDVKPENVMLSGNGTVKIGDFGQSQFFDRRDTLSRTLGTPAYLAPEVCAGESYRGRQADVWALGVSLYLFMYGDMPFKGDSVLELYDAVVEQEVPYPAGGPISFELQDLFMRLLCKDPLHRITAAEVMQHPWVSGSAWQVVLPDISRSPDSRGGASSEGAEGTHHSSSAGLNAEELAAVVFPAMHGEAGPCGSSPRSAGDSRTHLVDALAAASIAAGEDDVALRLAHSPRSRLHKLAGDSMLKQAWGRSISGGTRDKPPASETVTEADDEATSGQIPSHESTPVEAARQQSWPQPGAEWGNAVPPAAAARGAASAAAPAPELAPLAANASDAEESSSTGGGDVLDDMVLTMDGVRQAQQQQAQQHQQASGEVEQHKSSAPDGTQQPPAAAAFGTPEGGASWPSGSCRGAGIGERPAVEHQQDSSDIGSRSRAHSAGGGGGGSAPNLFRRSLRRLSAATSGEDGRERQQSLDHDTARSYPAAGAMGSVGSAFGGGGSGGKGLKARSIDTLRSMFVGPADFLLTDGSMTGHPLRQSPAAAARTGGLSAGLAESAEVAGEGGGGPRLPPRVPPARPSREQPVVINTFRPGERMIVASGGQQQQACFYIEEGVAELRYEADVPVTLSSILAAAFPTSLFRRPASAAASSTPTAASGGPAHQRQPSSSSQPRSQQRGRRPSQDASPDPFDQALQAERLELPGGASSGNGEAATAAAAELGRTSSLAAVVEQATLRAEALLSNAKAGSVDHLLVSERTTSEFLGGLAMLDARIFMGRWKATAVALTHVVAMHMNREGLELFLQQNPLAQVHLRASMAKARAEVVKLEALEKIAVAHQRQHQLTQKLRSRRRLSGSVGSARVHRQPAVPPGTPALLGPLRGAPSTAEAAAGVAPADAALGAVCPVVEPLAEPSAVSTAAAAEAAVDEQEVSSARTPTTASSSSAASDQGDDSEGDDGLASALSAGISSSTLELFSMVSKLRQQIDSQLLHLIQQSGSQQYAVAPGADTETP